MDRRHLNATAAGCTGCGCFFADSGSVPFGYFGGSAVAAFLVLAFQLLVVATHLRGSGCTRRSVAISLTCLLLATALRGAWFSLRACGSDDAAEHWINRFSTLMFFTGFSTYLETWILFLRQTRTLGGRSSSEFAGGSGGQTVCFDYCFSLQASRAWNVGINLAVWLCILSLSAAFWADYDAAAQESRSCPRCGAAGYTVISVVCLLISLLFIGVGHSMYATLKSAGSGNRRIMAVARKVVIVGSVCAVCFLLRSVFWLWEPVSGQFSPPGSYPFLHYTVTGLLPTLVLNVVLAPAGKAPVRRRPGGQSNVGMRGTAGRLEVSDDPDDAEGDENGRRVEVENPAAARD